MKEKRLHILMRITELGTFIVALTAVIAGILLLWDNAAQVPNYQALTREIFSSTSLSHQIIMGSLFLLIGGQLLRLIIITCDFARNKEWIFVGMGGFILLIIGWSINS